MSKRLAPGQSYKGRPPGVVPINVSLDRDAYDILTHHAPTRKGYGRFVARLLYEYAERQRLVGKLRAVMTEEVTTGRA